MGKSAHTVSGFSVTRSGGFGKLDTTTIRVHFPASSGPKAVLNDWSNWLTQPKGLKYDNPKERKAVLTLYHWSGCSMDRTAGTRVRALHCHSESHCRRLTGHCLVLLCCVLCRASGDAAAGQLKVLFTLTLNDVTIDKLESGEGVATLKVGSIEMSKK